jgi:hypothetical protein
VRSLLFTRRWLVRHLIAIVLIAACLRLGWWQWDRAQAAGGSPQNLGYALQWPFFGIFVGYMWLRMLRIEATGRTGPPESAAPVEPVDPRAPAPRTVEVRRRYAPGPVASPADADLAGDAELAAYNRYLSGLDAGDPIAATARPGPDPRPPEEP